MARRNEMTLPNDTEIDDNLADRLSALLAELLDAERRSIAGTNDARRNELARMVEDRQAVLDDDGKLDGLFGQYVTELTYRPNRVQERRLFAEWEDNLKSELLLWQGELLALDGQSVDKQTIYESARNKTTYLLRRAAEDADLLPDSTGILDLIRGDGNDQITSAQDNGNTTGKPKRFYIASRRNGILAQCDVYSRNRIVILAGSTAIKRKLNEHYSALQNRKDKLIADGTLIDSGELYTFTRDYPTTSASAAAGIVLGNTGTTKPLQSLKDADNIPVGEYFLKQS